MPTRLKKILSYLLLSPIISLLAVTTLSTIPPANAVIAEQPCDTYSWTGEDDTAHQMVLTNPLTLGDITYQTTYVTTNGTLTFGTPDANFSSYPNTPSISLAGYDWVTFGEGARLSYGSTDTGFCVEWRVRPFPQSGGNLTTIKLTVDTSRLPSWSGIIETTGWLPADLRRGIRFTSGQEVVTISEAFTINGGRPVEMQTCWDNSIIPLTSTCPAEPPPGQCWDGSTIPWNGTCPPVPPDTQCWDGSWVTWSQTCPPQPEPITCWDGSVIPGTQTCPPVPPDTQCWDGSWASWRETCPPEPDPIICWDDSVVPYNQSCPPTPPDIVCWDGQVVSWNASCRQVPPPIECWNGSQVNWNEQCPPRPPTTPEGAYVVQEGSILNVLAPSNKKVSSVLGYYGDPNDGSRGQDVSSILSTLLVGQTSATVQVSNSTFENDPAPGTVKVLIVLISYEDMPVEPSPTATQQPQPSEPPQPTVSPSPEPSESNPQPQPTSEPTLEPSPTPTPSESQSVDPEPEPSQTQSPEPEPSVPSQPTPSPEESPSPDPDPEATDLPSNNDIIDAAVEEAILDGSISDADTQEIIENLLSDGDITDEELTNLSDSLVSDGELTQDEKELLADVLVEQADGEAITSEMIDELGLDFEDLPEDQPVSLENGVVLLAVVADALEIFSNPSEILGAVFTDPGKALTAVANIGEDMTDATRKESQKVVIAAVIAAQVLTTASMVGRVR